MLQWIVIVYFFVTNLVLPSMTGYDREQTKRGNWRTPERRLLTIGLAGGGLGELTGQKRSYHETQKPVLALRYSISVIAMISRIYLTFK